MADDPPNAQPPPDMESDEHWIQAWWRPAMGWSYLVICVFDFIVFPAANAALFGLRGVPYQEWHPLTLQGGGLYHIAMGAIVGVTSWQRTREKMASFDNNFDRH